MKIAISSDSAIDLQSDLISKYDIKTVPFAITLGDKNAYDGEITAEEIFDYVEKTGVLPKTSAVNEYQMEEHFSHLLKEYDAVIHFDISSTMSAAYANAVEASKKFKNVYIIDSGSLSTGIALLAIYAKQLADQGLEAEHIIQKVEARKAAVQASFVINTTKYLYKGGRCSGLARFGSMLLRIKPQIIVNNGSMITGKMYMGKFSKVVREYVSDTLKQFHTPDKQIVFVTYSSSPKEVVDEVIATLKNKGFERIYCTRSNATVTSHCGPKTLGILYLNDGVKSK